MGTNYWMDTEICKSSCFAYYPRISFQPILTNAGVYPRLALRFDVDPNDNDVNV